MTPDLFSETAPEPRTPHFDGVTYDKARDHKRLTSAMDRVCALMSDGQWRTLKSIATLADTSEAGASARLRDFRKSRFSEKYGVQSVDRRNVGDGLWEYRVIAKAQ